MFNPDQLISTINCWIAFLDQYTMKELIASEGPGSWSIGQLYIHLVRDSTFYLEQAKIAHSINDHTNGDASPIAKEMFQNDAFPDIKIEGHPSNAFFPIQKINLN